MENSEIREFSLYIHIPFCRSRCDYCSFHSTVMDPENPQILISVIKDIIKNIKAIPEKYPNAVIPTVYIGGGTPSCIPSELLNELLSEIRLLLRNTHSVCKEWTVEINPGDINSGILTSLEYHGVDRISIGIQSFDKRIRKILGRKDNDASVDMCLKLISINWKGKSSVDLIHSVPQQSCEDIANDIKVINQNGIKHVSWYGLSIEEGTPLFQKGLKEAHKPDQQEIIDRELENAGLHRYEISNFAETGFESLHNLRYWYLEPWLGIGPGAVSMMPGNDGLPCRTRYGEQDSEIITPVELFKEYFMMGLRTRAGVDLTSIETVFGINPLGYLKNFISDHDEFLIADKERIRLNTKGLDISNSILVDLFLETEKTLFPSRNIVWPIFSLD